MTFTKTLSLILPTCLHLNFEYVNACFCTPLVYGFICSCCMVTTVIASELWSLRSFGPWTVLWTAFTEVLRLLVSARVLGDKC